MEYETHIRETLPEVEKIRDQDLQDSVVDAWVISMQENNVDDLNDVLWYPPLQREYNLPNEYLVPHIREVTQCAIEIAEIIAENEDSSLNIDLVIAGGLLHDVSKLYENHGETETKIGNLFGHPYSGVYATMAVDLPEELGHIVLSHTDRTNIEPAILEAEIVKRADEASFGAIKARAVDDLRDL